MAFPSNPPNYNSANAMSAWWIERGAAEQSVVATTGNAFVKRLQNQLTEYFGALARNRVINALDPNIHAYSGGRADVAEIRFDWTQIGSDGNWGPVTNAALWRWVENQRAATVGADALHGLQFHLDQIELTVKNGRINFETLKAAIWAARHPTIGFAAMAGKIELATTAMLGQITPPPWRHATPAPVSAELGKFYTWNPDTTPVPTPLSQGGGSPVIAPPATATPGTPVTTLTPAPPGTPATMTPAVSTAGTSEDVKLQDRTMGLTRNQWLLGGGILLAVGGIAYFTKDKKPALPGGHGGPRGPYGNPSHHDPRIGLGVTIRGRGYGSEKEGIVVATSTRWGGDDEVTIRWPSGQTTTHPSKDVNIGYSGAATIDARRYAMGGR